MTFMYHYTPDIHITFNAEIWHLIVFCCSQTGAVDRSLDIMLEIDHHRPGDNDRQYSAETLVTMFQ